MLPRPSWSRAIVSLDGVPPTTRMVLAESEGSAWRAAAVTETDFAAAGPERDREGVRAGVGGGERVVRRQRGLSVRARQVDRPAVAGDLLAVNVPGQDGDAPGGAPNDG